MALELNLALYNEALFEKRFKESYFGKYYQMKKDVERKIAEVLGGKIVSFEDLIYNVIVNERNSGETFVSRIKSISSHSFVTNEGKFELSEMDLGNLCVILDYLITGEW